MASLAASRAQVGAECKTNLHTLVQPCNGREGLALRRKESEQEGLINHEQSQRPCWARFCPIGTDSHSECLNCKTILPREEIPSIDYRVTTKSVTQKDSWSHHTQRRISPFPVYSFCSNSVEVRYSKFPYHLKRVPGPPLKDAYPDPEKWQRCYDSGSDPSLR